MHRSQREAASEDAGAEPSARARIAVTLSLHTHTQPTVSHTRASQLATQIVVLDDQAISDSEKVGEPGAHANCG